MRRARIYLFLILALALVVAGCGTQTSDGQLPQSTLNIIDTVVTLLPEVDLPAIQITYNQEGVPSVLGFTTTDVSRLTGINLSFLNLDPVFIDWFMRSNVQHVEFEHRPNGLLLYINGELLPSIGWSAESLNNTIEVADMFDVPNTAVIERLFPVLQKLGIDLVLRFPVASGNAPVPLNQESGMLPSPAQPEDEAPVIHLALEYQENGLPSIMGLTSQDIRALTGLDLSPLELSSGQIARLKALNLQNVELETRTDGLYLFVNGKELPRLAYSPQQIDALAGWYGQLYPGYLPTPGVLAQGLMLLQQTDLDFTVQFPVSTEAK